MPISHIHLFNSKCLNLKGLNLFLHAIANSVSFSQVSDDFHEDEVYQFGYACLYSSSYHWKYSI